MVLPDSTATWLSVALLQFASLCGAADVKCGASLTSTQGTIISPGFDKGMNYNNSQDCEWYIVPRNENSSVRIAFQSFDIEEDFDYLMINSDPPAYSTFVARFDGSQLPYDLLCGGPLRLRFHSDHVVTRTGFNLSYTTVEGIAPRFLSFANDQHVVKGDEVVLPCNVTGIPQPVVTWYKDGLEVHSVLQSKFTLRGNDLVIEGIAEEDSGFFKCKAQNYLNSTEQVLQLNVYVPPVILFHPTSVHLDSVFKDIKSSIDHHFDKFYSYYRKYDKKISAVFRCGVYGNPRPTIYWKKDGKLLLNPYTVNDWLVISQVTMSDKGIYTCFANSSIGSAESTVASLTIGRVMPCCFGMDLSNYFTATAGSTTVIEFSFIYGGYTLLNVTVTKDGYHYQPLIRSRFYERTYSRTNVHIFLGSVAANDTGVYGYHLNLLSSTSNSAPLRKLTVSFYVPILVQVNVPPLVTVRPSNVALQDYNDRLHISCSVYSLESAISWYKNNEPLRSNSKTTIEGNKLTKAYLSVDNTPDDVNHYTCEAVNSDGLSSRATVSVVLRVEEGGWSWWMETLPCSVTCGFTRGVRLRSRRCYNESSRCPGDNIQITTCYSTLLNCPPERNIIYTPSTAKIETISSTSPAITSISLTTTSVRKITSTFPATTSTTADYDTADYDATSSTSNTAWSRSLQPTIISSTNATMSEVDISCARSSQSAVTTAAAVSGVVTGLIAAALSATVTYFCVNRRDRKREQKDTPSVSLEGGASSPSHPESLRYVTARSRPKRITAEAPSSVEATRKPTVKYSSNDDQVHHQLVGASEHYMHVLHSESQGVKELAGYQKLVTGTTSEYAKPIPCRKSSEEEKELYLRRPSKKQREGVREGTHYSNTRSSSGAYEEQVYANQ